ncbi:MAG: hypothetical protein ACPG4X_16440 [Pikeienuella sp.]
MAYLGARKSGYELGRLGIREGGFSGLPADDGSTIGSASGDYSTPAGLTFTELSANGDGTYQTVGSGASDGRYNGTYTLSAEQYADLTNEGITWLRLADSLESPTDTFTADGQLWIWDEDQTPEFSAQWIASGVNLLGTGDSYSRHASDTRALTYIQTGKVPSGSPVTALPVTAAAAGTYVPNVMNKSGQVLLKQNKSVFEAAHDPTPLTTFSGWYTFNDWPAGHDFMVMGGLRLTSVGGQIRIRMKDSGGATIYDARIAQPSLSTLHHIAITVDLTVPSFTILVDGVVPPVISTSTALVSGTGNMERTDVFPFGAGSNDMDISDLVLIVGEAVDGLLFWNGGTQTRVSDVTLNADYHFGGVMKADADQLGDTSAGLNDLANLGSAGLMSSITNSVTDVV